MRKNHQINFGFRTPLFVYETLGHKFKIYFISMGFLLENCSNRCYECLNENRHYKKF